MSSTASSDFVGSTYDQSVHPATKFYQDQMHSFLEESKIPPTEWELNQRHESTHRETLNRFGSNNNNKNNFEDAIRAAYAQVRQDHKELRHRGLIESVLGR